MKKFGIVFFIIITLMIAGCGSNAPAKGKVSGTIVDQNNNPVSGVVVKIGTLTATSQNDGSFNFDSVLTGTYTVITSGGTPNSGDTSNGPGTGHLTATVKKSVTTGDNDFGAIKVYNILGYGVISKSTSAIESSSIPGIRGEYLKAAITGEPLYSTSGKTSQNIVSGSGGTRDNFWDLNPRFIYLKWAPLTEGWISHYKITYLGTDGAANATVWDSDVAHAGDPAFDLANPKAYLDIADELDTKVSGPGTYQFQITGYSADGTQSKPLPVITVSIGMLMNSFPIPHLTGAELSWSEVTGSDGYIAGLYHDSISSANEVFKTNSLQHTATVDLSEYVTLGVTYCCSINAHALDNAGWTAEITNATGQFTY